MEKLVSALTPLLEANDLNEYVLKGKDAIMSLEEPLKEAFVSADLDSAKHKIILREKLGSNVSIASSTLNSDPTDDFDGAHYKELFMMRKSIEGSIQVILAAKYNDSGKPVLNSTDTIRTAEKISSFFGDASRKIYRTEEVYSLLLNYIALSYRLEQREHALSIIEILYEETMHPVRNLELNKSFHFRICFLYIDMLLRTNIFMTYDEVCYSPTKTSKLSFDASLLEVFQLAAKIMDKIEELFVSQQPQPEIVLSVMKYRLHYLKSFLRMMENSIKQARKEIKTALDIYQHEVKGKLTSSGVWQGIYGLSYRKPKYSYSVESLEDSMNSSALCLKANLEFLKYNHRKSVKLLQSSLKVGLHPVTFFNNMSCIHHAIQQPATAMLYLEKSIQDSIERFSSPLQRASVAFNLGLELIEVQEYEAAIECLSKTNGAFIDKPEIYLLISRASVGFVGNILKAEEANLTDSVSDFLVSNLQNGLTVQKALEAYYEENLSTRELSNDRALKLASRGLVAVERALQHIQDRKGVDFQMFSDATNHYGIDKDIIFSLADYSELPMFPTALSDVVQELLLNKAYLSLYVTDYIAVLSASWFVYKLLKREEAQVDEEITSVRASADLGQEATFFLERKVKILSSITCVLGYMTEACMSQYTVMSKQAFTFASRCVEELESFKTFTEENESLIDRLGIDTGMDYFRALATVNAAIAGLGTRDISLVLGFMKRSLDILPGGPSEKVASLKRGILRAAYVSALKGGNLEAAVEIIGKATLRF